MNKQKTAQKILDFCQESYPEISWEQTNYIESTICIWGKTNRIGISVEIIETQLESHVVLGDVSAFISEARWSGSFKIWLDRKESQFSFKSKREFDTSTDLFIKAKDILSSIFEFIETKIQNRGDTMNITEVTTKILDFCQGTYPDLRWDDDSWTGQNGEPCIYGCKAFFVGLGITTIKIYIDMISHDSNNLQVDLIKGYSTIDHLAWEGVFTVWVNQKKNNEILFKGDGICQYEELNLWRKKGTQIMIDIFEFIENEIQTEVTL